MLNQHECLRGICDLSLCNLPTKKWGKKWKKTTEGTKTERAEKAKVKTWVCKCDNDRRNTIHHSGFKTKNLLDFSTRVDDYFKSQ